MRIDRKLDAQWQERTHTGDSGELQSLQLAASWAGSRRRLAAQPTCSRLAVPVAPEDPHAHEFQSKFEFRHLGPMRAVGRANCRSKYRYTGVAARFRIGLVAR